METKKIADELAGVARGSSSYIREWKARTGRKILGYFCTNTPEEMIQAAGFLPFRILPSSGSISLASRHLQSYSCSLVQSSLEAGLRGDLDFLDGTVFPHTCDSIQRLSDIWAANLKFPFHWDVVLPVKLYTETARTYLIQELRRFRRGLEEFTARPVSDADLQAAITLLNENRRLLREVYLRRARHPDRLSASYFWAVIKTANLMPKEDHNSSLKALLSSFSGATSSAFHRVGLFLIGSVCDDLPFYRLLDSSGAYVVGDDLCTGWRYFSDDVSLDGDPIEALADRLMHKVPCPCKHNPEIDRGEKILQRVKDSGARGVVFLLLKFCDPHAFDYPYLKEKLEKSRIPSLLLEIEPGGYAAGAIETRLAAFLETLGS